MRVSLPSLAPTIVFQKQKKKAIWFEARHIHRRRFVVENPVIPENIKMLRNSRPRVDQPGHGDLRDEQPRYQPAVPPSPGYV